MTCEEARDRIEPVAGGEAADEAFRTHVETCVRCAAALARARTIEAALASRPAPAAPPRFAPAVASRIRREYWRAEQQVDRLFNAAVAAALVAIAGGTLALVNLSGVTAAIRAGLAALPTLAAGPATSAAAQAAPLASTYLFGGAFLVTALIVWSWAERSGRSS